MHAYRYPEHEQRVAALARAMGFAQVSVSHEVSPLIKLVGRGDTTVVDAYLSPIIRRYVATVAEEMSARQCRIVPSPACGGGDERSGHAGWDSSARLPTPPPYPSPASGGGSRPEQVARSRPSIDRRHPPDVHDVVGRADGGRIVPGQGRDPVGSGRRRGRHGGDRARGRIQSPDRLRHGRHLDRRVALRWRIRARVRDRGRGRAHARADDADPHRGGGRRLDPAFRRRALPRRPGFGGRQSRTDLLPARRPARGHRRQRHGRQAHAGFLPEDFRPGAGPAARCRRGARGVRGARQGGRRQDAGGDRRRLHQDRGREHGERDQEDFRAARLRRDALRAQLLRRRRRPARLPGRRLRSA